MIKSWRVILVVLYLASLMGGFLYYAHRPLAGGTIVVLQVEPFDPRDLLMGNYARLQYPQLNVPLPDNLQSSTVYALLTISGNTVESVQLVPEKPSSGTYIEGKITERGRIEFGIERYYAPREKAEGLEKDLREHKDIVAVVSIGKEGAARLVNVAAPITMSE